MPVTTMRVPTMGGVSISLTALENYLSIRPTMEKKSEQVERRLLAGSNHRDGDEVPSSKGDAADGSTCHPNCFRNLAASLFRR